MRVRGIFRLTSITASLAAGLFLSGLARAADGSILGPSADVMFADALSATGSEAVAPAPDLASQFPGYDLQLDSNFAGPLMGSPLSLPFAAGEHFADQTIALASDLHLTVGEADAGRADTGLPLASGLGQLELSRATGIGGSRAFLAAADWNFASWGGLGIAASRADSSFVFGAPVRFELPNTTTMLGISAHVNFGSGWVTSFSFDEGRTQLDLRPNALAFSGDEVDSQEFGIGISKNDIFGKDALGISLVRPPSESVLLAPQVSLTSSTPETDLQLDYETSFNGNITLQANAGYQMNVAGQNGSKAISVLSRAKINF